MLPCLLFGAETWILNTTLLQKLESFQAELAKCILRIPTYTSKFQQHCTHGPAVCSGHPCEPEFSSLVKLCFLLKVVRSDLSLSGRVFRSLAASDVESLAITRQCRFLESIFQSNYTTVVLTSSDEISNHSLKKEKTMLDYRCKKCVNAFPSPSLLIPPFPGGSRICFVTQHAGIELGPHRYDATQSYTLQCDLRAGKVGVAHCAVTQKPHYLICRSRPG